MITPPEIEDYCLSHSSKDADLFRELSDKTKAYAPQVSQMQVGALEGGFLSMITKALQAKRVLEFGTFTGCSSLHFALSLPSDGLVTTLDRDPKAVAIAQAFWKKAGVDSKVESKVGDARNTARALADEIKSGVRLPYDISFIDADKAGYDEYFELSLAMLRPDGLIIVDNVLWSGAVLDPKEDSDRAIHALNVKLKSDPRVEVLMLPIRDGITIARKKP